VVRLFGALDTALLVSGTLAATASARGGCGSNGPLSILDPQTDSVTLSPSPAPAGSTVRGTVHVSPTPTRDMFVFLQINDNAVTGLRSSAGGSGSRTVSVK
jgi:hypothetical protein